MSKYQKYFIGVIGLVLLATFLNIYKPLVRGLDIAGGIRVVMQVDPQRPEDWPQNPDERREKMAAIRRTIQNRVKGLAGVTEPVVVVQNPNAALPRLVIELPGVKNPEEALNRISSTASLEFYWLKDVQNNNNPMGMWRMEPPYTEDKPYIFTGPRGETIDSIKQPDEVLKKVVNNEKNKPILSGKDLLANARANINQRNQIVINIEFNRDGTEVFRKFTRAHVEDILAVFFDGKLMTAPTINEPIPSGKAEISGFKSLQEARKTAEFLNAGALPVPLKVMARNSVEPTLGAETVRQVVFAGIIGLILVVLFTAIYYRLPGIIASIALGLYALFVIAAFKLVGATMSLSGIAALIISIGMAVDANILIFERLKEELRSGKTLRAAIDAGFNRAFTAIFDSNMCTAITCATLLWYGTPSVQSFALTLLIGVAISMFTAITVTRTVLHLLVGWAWAQQPSLYGLTSSWVSKAGVNVDIVGSRKYWFILSACLILPGLIVLAKDGLKPGIEFKAGTSLQVGFEQPVSLDGVRSVVNSFVPGSSVQLADGRTMAFITTELQRTELGEKVYNEKMSGIREALDKQFRVRKDPNTGSPAFAEDSVEPVISKELTSNAFWAVILASVGIVLYLTGRFAIGGIGSGFKFGVCAVIALIHDAAFILGLFAILGKVAGWEVGSLFVTAVLTVIGYSVHDTIVVYDRIRENMRHRQRGESYEQLCNRSILQTFSRSINTGLTVVLTLGALIVFGGPLLRQFYVALLVGIMIGTYSSIFNAAQMVVVWDGIASRAGQKKKKAFEDKPLVSRATPSPLDTPVTSTEAGEEPQVDASEAAGEDADKPARIKRKTTKKRRY